MSIKNAPKKSPAVGPAAVKVAPPSGLDVEALRAQIAPLAVQVMGGGIELWKVQIAALKEQSLNARAMQPDAFNQLAGNIAKRGGALESLPFCALTAAGLEIVSGHHRTRAARKAGVEELWVLVDVTGLSRDAIRAKQLAHNSLQGQDNEQLVRQIFEQIQDADARIEAFIIPSVSQASIDVSLSTKSLEIEFDTKTAVLIFLPAQFAAFKAALEALKVQAGVDEVFLCARDEYETLTAAMDLVGATYKITSTPTILARMAMVTTAALAAKALQAAP